MLLAMAAVATAWAAYQSASWRGEQAKAQSASIAARVESTRAANVANRQGQIDVALFTQWVDAYARDETELADFYRRRFRDEFPPAFDAWVATRPRTNPNAPLSPFAMPQYKLAATAKADRLEAKAAAFSVRVGGYIQRADNYSLAGVLFAVVAVLRGHQHPAARVEAADGRSRARLPAVPRQRDLDRDVPGEPVRTGRDALWHPVDRWRASRARLPEDDDADRSDPSREDENEHLVVGHVEEQHQRRDETGRDEPARKHAEAHSDRRDDDHEHGGILMA